MRCAPSPGVGSCAALGFSGSPDRQGFKPWQPRISSRFRTEPVEIRRLNESVNCLVSVPPRRSAQDGASGEESMLTPDTHGRQRHGQVANHGDAWQRRACAGGIVADDATLVRDGDRRWEL